ncbi:MAG: peptidoglycan DD-metalloendopeptidase family protein [Deltaproteobacteria bacterium]|nr:peptidoglycan DD-metalloendopeptidase family protein [Deltaproteobacteria bacterium]
MPTKRPNDEGRSGVKRAVVGLVAAVLVAGTAAAYVPSASKAPPAPAPNPVAPTLPRDADSAGEFDAILSKLERRERELERELEEIGPRLDVVGKRVLARGRQYYRLVRVGMLPVGGGFDGLVDHATRVERLRAALSRDVATDVELRERQAVVRKELRQVRAERAPMVVQREAMKQAQHVMQEADDRRDAFQRAFGNSSDPPQTAIYGADTGPLAPDPKSHFAQMRGRLSFPLAGRAVVSQKDRGTTMLQLRASRDTAVRAVYAGTVAFAGETDRGMTVVIDHGDHYFSTYGNLQNLDVKIGDSLQERGRIGWVKRHEGKSAMLHFELRRGSSVLEAGPWLGL